MKTIDSSQVMLENVRLNFRTGKQKAGIMETTIHVRLTKKQRQILDELMNALGVSSISDYIRSIVEGTSQPLAELVEKYGTKIVVTSAIDRMEELEVMLDSERDFVDTQLPRLIAQLKSHSRDDERMTKKLITTIKDRMRVMKSSHYKKTAMEYLFRDLPTDLYDQCKRVSLIHYEDEDGNITVIGEVQ